ncbi:MAG: hypothetical protein JKP98_01615 [Rhodobacteraceae bacterium]|nr:hypothetical protein [Paracoccaceae bacterium]
MTGGAPAKPAAPPVSAPEIAAGPAAFAEREAVAADRPEAGPTAAESRGTTTTAAGSAERGAATAALARGIAQQLGEALAQDPRAPSTSSSSRGSLAGCAW